LQCARSIWSSCDRIVGRRSRISDRLLKFGDALAEGVALFNLVVHAAAEDFDLGLDVVEPAIHLGEMLGDWAVLRDWLWGCRRAGLMGLAASVRTGRFVRAWPAGKIRPATEAATYKPQPAGLSAGVCRGNFPLLAFVRVE
jgi:hypothetical protein